LTITGGIRPRLLFTYKRGLFEEGSDVSSARNSPSECASGKPVEQRGQFANYGETT